MFHKSRIFLAVLLCLVMLTGCSSVELEQHITLDTVNNNKAELDIPKEWVYSSDGDIALFALTDDKLSNDDWVMMLTANLISTVGEDATAVEIATKVITSGFEGRKYTTESLGGDCIFVKVDASELNYFIVSDDDAGIYLYGRIYNAEVDEETAKAIAESIQIGD
ncbi:MAG: hypothetical protein IJ462_03310 [Clostridia bacterium]|nr:hypothetical protein [Clostridia bacterium]